jgi:hypothetical protein
LIPHVNRTAVMTVRTESVKIFFMALNFLTVLKFYPAYQQHQLKDCKQRATV